MYRNWGHDVPRLAEDHRPAAIFQSEPNIANALAMPGTKDFGANSESHLRKSPNSSSIAWLNLCASQRIVAWMGIRLPIPDAQQESRHDVVPRCCAHACSTSFQQQSSP